MRHRYKIIDEENEIPNQNIIKVFNSIYQKDPSFEKQEVDLTIANKIIKMHQGEMGVASDENHNAAIWFTLPKTD